MQCINRHIIVIGILLRVGFPKILCGNTRDKESYLVYKCTITWIDFKTPMAVWSRKSVDYSNLKIFKILVFVHIKLDKIDIKNIKCVFISYPEFEKYYKLWDVKFGGLKFIISM